jgi:hypothetical protein
MQKFDYTYKRLGSKEPRRGRKIKICPKCGRRGAYQPPRELYDARGKPTGKMISGEYVHLEEFDGFFTFMRDICHEPKAPDNS